MPIDNKVVFSWKKLIFSMYNFLVFYCLAQQRMKNYFHIITFILIAENDFYFEKKGS